MVPITTLLQVALLIAPLATYGFAVVKTRAEEKAVCKVQIVAEVQKVADKINADAEAKIAEAAKAAEAIGPTPKSKPEIKALCDRSASCRERKR